MNTMVSSAWILTLDATKIYGTQGETPTRKHVADMF